MKPNSNPQVGASDLSPRALAVLAVPPGARVLDVGAGDGSAAVALAQRGAKVWALDIDPALEAAATRCCEGVLIGDIEAQDCRLPEGPFEFVLLLDVLGELRRPAEALRRCAALLVPGGRLIVSLSRAAAVEAAAGRLFAEAGCVIVDELACAPPDPAQRVAARDPRGALDLFVLAGPGDGPLVASSLAGELWDRLQRAAAERPFAPAAVSGSDERTTERMRELERCLRERTAALRRLEMELRHARADLELQPQLIRALRERLAAMEADRDWQIELRGQVEEACATHEDPVILRSLLDASQAELAALRGSRRPLTAAVRGHLQALPGIARAGLRRRRQRH
ncbi:MAG: hypothetical protein NVSMB51_20440 [Solirubrobacteraceae bacterium]